MIFYIPYVSSAHELPRSESHHPNLGIFSILAESSTCSLVHPLKSDDSMKHGVNRSPRVSHANHHCKPRHVTSGRNPVPVSTCEYFIMLLGSLPSALSDPSPPPRDTQRMKFRDSGSEHVIIEHFSVGHVHKDHRGRIFSSV